MVLSVREVIGHQSDLVLVNLTKNPTVLPVITTRSARDRFGCIPVFSARWYWMYEAHIRKLASACSRICAEWRFACNQLMSVMHS